MQARVAVLRSAVASYDGIDDEGAEDGATDGE